MPALETFDWFMKELWPHASNELKKFFEERRSYLLDIRNENERRRFVEELIRESRAIIRKKKS